MDDLVTFLRARLDEDEQAARAVEDGSAPWDGQWIADGPNALRTRNGHVLAYGHRTTDGRDLPMPLKPGFVSHVARHDPASTLREVAAMRHIAELHSVVHRDIVWLENGAETTDELPVCGLCVPRHSAYQDRDDVPEGYCTTLRLLAYAYADHPDYQEQWRP